MTTTRRTPHAPRQTDADPSAQLVLPWHGESVDPSVAPASAARFSSFAVYVDESGDHGLEALDPHYPVFVLAFCVFHKGHYAQTVVPAIESFKFKHFGHDIVVLHEQDIRKEKGAFRFNDRAEKEAFLDELTGLIDTSKFVLISCVIQKAKLKERAQLDSNPYHLALGFCLETLFELIQEKRQEACPTHVVVECRGKKKIAILSWNSGASATGRIAGGGNYPSLSSSQTRKRILPVYSLRIWWLVPSGFPCFGRIGPTGPSKCSGESFSARVAAAGWAWTSRGGG